MQLSSFIKTKYQPGPGDILFKMDHYETRKCSECGNDFETIFRPKQLCDDCIHRHRGLDANSLRMQRAALRMGELEKMGIPGRLRNMTLESFNQDGQPKAYAAIAQLSQDWPNPKVRNIALLGDRGIGKTHLGVGLLLDLYDKGWKGQYVYWPSTVAAIKSAEDQREAERRLLEPLKTTPFLVIDDVGKEKLTDHLEGWRDIIFNERWVEGAATIITANLSIAELREWLGPASASRFMSDLSFPAMYAVDRRDQPIAAPVPKYATPRMDTPCPTCAGAGWVTNERYPIGYKERLMMCRTCRGRGW